MNNRPTMPTSMQLPPLKLQRYERYLPTAFDESLSLLEKVNRVIQYLYEYSELTDEMLIKWNEVYGWVMGEGLDSAIGGRLMEWKENGLLDEIINKHIFGELNDKIDKVYDDFETLSDELKNKIQKLTDELETLIKDSLKRDTVEFSVGNNGDFNLLQKAIDHIIEMSVYPIKATVRLLDGFVFDEQVTIKDVDLHFVEIVARGTVDVRLSKADKIYHLGTNHGDKVVPIIYGKNAIMPTLNFKMRYRSDSISKDSKELCGCILDNSQMTIKHNNGFINFPYIGLGAYFNSHVVGHRCDYSGNGNRDELTDTSTKDKTYGFGLAVSHSSSYTGKGCKANRCGELGFMFFRNSSGYIDQSEAKDCGHHALIVHTASVCSARKCVFTHTIDDNVVIGDASMASLIGADCSHAKMHHGIIAHRGSRVMFENGKANNCGTNGIEVQFNSTMNAKNAQAFDNGKHGLFVRNGSTLYFGFGESRRNGSKGLSAQKGSMVDMDRAIVKNNVVGVSCLGSTVSTDQTTVSENTRDGIDAWYGGIVQGRKNSIVKNGRYGIKCYDGQITATDSRILQSGTDGVHATQGGIVNVTNTSIRDSNERAIRVSSATVNIAEGEMLRSGLAHTMCKNGGEINASNCNVDGSTPFNVHDGSRIYAHGTGGGTNTTPNTITNKGMILI